MAALSLDDSEGDLDKAIDVAVNGRLGMVAVGTAA